MRYDKTSDNQVMSNVFDLLNFDLSMNMFNVRGLLHVFRCPGVYFLERRLLTTHEGHRGAQNTGKEK